MPSVLLESLFHWCGCRRVPPSARLSPCWLLAASAATLRQGHCHNARRLAGRQASVVRLQPPEHRAGSDGGWPCHAGARQGIRKRALWNDHCKAVLELFVSWNLLPALFKERSAEYTDPSDACSQIWHDICGSLPDYREHLFRHSVLLRIDTPFLLDRHTFFT